MMRGPNRPGRRRGVAALAPEWFEVAATIGSELRRRADGPGLEGILADGMLRLLHHSAHLMTDMGSQLEQAITPPQAPRARRGSARKPGTRPSRVRRLKPED